VVTKTTAAGLTETVTTFALLLLPQPAARYTAANAAEVHNNVVRNFIPPPPKSNTQREHSARGS
jgi:hypothetical protein